MLNIETLKPGLIKSGFLNNVIYFEEIESTNDLISSPDYPVDTIVIAEYQSRGKGRYLSKWESEKNKNLTFSLKKDFGLSKINNNSVLHFFSYCTFLTIKEILSTHKITAPELNLWIKWPNDIYYKEKKLCGILSETKFGSGIYIIGIGINCNQENFSENLSAVSLKQITGKKIDLNRLLLDLITSFSKNIILLSLSKKDDLFKKWKSFTKLIGKECEFLIQNTNLNNGIITDLNEDGSISIHINDEIKKFYSGELKLTYLSDSKTYK